MRKVLRVDVTCKDCGLVFKKRKNSIKVWQGRCTECARKEVNSRPEIKEKYRINGLKFSERFGPSYLNSCRKPQPKKLKDKITELKYKELDKYRNSTAMKEWKFAIKQNANWTCECCGIMTKKLEADHILPFSLFPELRLDLNNGRAVCRPCHLSFGAKVTYGNLYRPAFSPVGL